MIEGLRLLPHTADIPIFNCETCQHGNKKMNLQAQPIAARRLQVCGYMPRDPQVKHVFGLPLSLDFQPSCCPGYLTGLPEVQEAVHLRPQWKEGTFIAYVGGGEMRMALDAQAVLEGAINAKERFEIKKRQEEAEAERNRHGH